MEGSLPRGAGSRKDGQRGTPKRGLALGGMTEDGDRDPQPQESGQGHPVSRAEGDALPFSPSEVTGVPPQPTGPGGQQAAIRPVPSQGNGYERCLPQSF